jgi:hypothetical protein
MLGVPLLIDGQGKGIIVTALILETFCRFQDIEFKLDGVYPEYMAVP